MSPLGNSIIVLYVILYHFYRYSCLPGYIQVGGSSQRSCNSSSKRWASGQDLLCECEWKLPLQLFYKSYGEENNVIVSFHLYPLITYSLSVHQAGAELHFFHPSSSLFLILLLCYRFNHSFSTLHFLLYFTNPIYTLLIIIISCVLRQL